MGQELIFPSSGRIAAINTPVIEFRVNSRIVESLNEVFDESNRELCLPFEREIDSFEQKLLVTGTTRCLCYSALFHPLFYVFSREVANYVNILIIQLPL